MRSREVGKEGNGVRANCKEHAVCHPRSRRQRGRAEAQREEAGGRGACSHPTLSQGWEAVWGSGGSPAGRGGLTEGVVMGPGWGLDAESREGAPAGQAGGGPDPDGVDPVP